MLHMNIICSKNKFFDLKYFKSDKYLRKYEENLPRWPSLSTREHGNGSKFFVSIRLSEPKNRVNIFWPENQETVHFLSKPRESEVEKIGAKVHFLAIKALKSSEKWRFIPYKSHFHQLWTFALSSRH